MKNAKKRPAPVVVDVPGARSASFKLVEKAEDSYELFRSSKKIGTGRVEERGSWSAHFEATRKRWIAGAPSAESLLRLVGAFVLAGEARAAAARPVEEIDPALKVKGKANADQKLSRQFAERAQERRLEEIDALIAECRKSIKAG